MPTQIKIGITLILGASILVGSQAASAQNALGSGDTLDANLQMRDGHRARRNISTPKTDYRARNLLITGNVASGRGFRGTVGYDAEFDFRGDLGSNNLYSFRADAALSSINFINAGASFSRIKYAQDIGLLQYDRSGRGASIGDVIPRRSDSRSLLNSERIRLDRLHLNSTSFTRGHFAAESSIVGGGYNSENDLLYVQTSPLQGVITSLAKESGKAFGLSIYDTIRLREEQAGAFNMDSIEERFTVSFSPSASKNTRSERDPSPLAVSNRIVSSTPSGYRDILDRIASRYAGVNDVEISDEPGMIRQLSRQYEQLREKLHQNLAARTPSRTLEIPEDAESESPSPTRKEDVLTKLLDAISHDESLDGYTSDTNSRFSELMRQGEQQLTEGNFFRAEQHFAHALRFQKSHPLALAGIVHAQIGAEVYPSATLGIRQLLIEHPEMIATRYQVAMLPPQESLRQAVSALNIYIARGTSPLADGLLLAYLGHLLEDKNIIILGLKTVEEADSEDALLPILRQIWLGEVPSKE